MDNLPSSLPQSIYVTIPVIQRRI